MRKNMIDYGPVQRVVEQRVAALSDVLQEEAGIETLLVSRGIAVGTRQYQRIRNSYANCVGRGYGSVYHVDEVCCDVLGMHPMELYGNGWLHPETTHQNITPKPAAA